MVASCNISTFLINQTFKRKNELLRFSPFPLWSAVVPHFGPSPFMMSSRPFVQMISLRLITFRCAREIFSITLAGLLAGQPQSEVTFIWQVTSGISYHCTVDPWKKSQSADTHTHSELHSHATSRQDTMTQGRLEPSQYTLCLTHRGANYFKL